MAEDWTDDIEEILSKVRQNCIDMYKYHLCRYFQYKRVLPIFRVPVLILNALNSVFSVGLQPYMEQGLISVLNCLISLIATLINSIEMYMGIQKSMESEMSSSQGFYILSIGIYKMLTLTRENRDTSGKQYLMECYNTYSELVRNSKLIKDPYMLQKDFLQNVDKSIGGIRGGGVNNNGIEDADLINTLNDNKGFDLEEMTMKALQSKPIPSHPSPYPLLRDVENGISEPSFSIKDLQDSVSSPYPKNIIAVSKTDVVSHPHHHHHHHHHPHPHRPSFTDEHDPLYSLSRKSIFGTPKKSSFLEMAGVNLGDSDHTAEDVHILDRIGSIRSIFSNISMPHSIPTSNPPSPEVSYHSHHHSHHTLQKKEDEFLPQPPPQLPRNIATVQLENEKEELSTNESNHSITVPIQEEIQVQPLQSKEKGVKGIVMQIENKPKKEVIP